MPRLITVTSARGGVGTSCITVNLAVQLAQRGQRVCLWDADQTGSNLTAMLGLRPCHSFRDHLVSGVPLDEVVMRDRFGVDVLPGCDSAQWLAGLQPEQRQRLADGMVRLEENDFVLIDTLAGVGNGPLALALASPELIVTVTPGPARLSEGYALLKLCAARRYAGSLSVLINRTRSHTDGKRAFDNFNRAASRHLELQPALAGMVREDANMPGVGPQRGPLISRRPYAPAARDLAAVAARLLSDRQPAREDAACLFGDTYLQLTAGAAPPPAALIAAPSPDRQQSRQALQEQIEALSGRIDELIAEVERMRSEHPVAASRGERAEAPEAGASTEDLEAWVAERASGSELVRLAEDAFPIYHIRRPGGEMLRIACHRGGAELGKTGTQSRSS